MKNNKYLLLFVILFFIFSINVNASTVTSSRNKDNNYGVNKKWLIHDGNIPNVMNTPLVDVSEKIYDYANILTDDEEERLYKLIINFCKRYNTEVIILTVNESYYSDSKNETIASDFYDYNDFGIDYPKYDGIVIYRNVYEDDPYYDIYTFGDAQLYFNDSRYNQVLDYVYNDLHSGNYYQGFSTFLEYFEYYYKDGIVRKNYYVDDYGYLQEKYVPPFIIAIIISGIITGIVVTILVKRNKMIVKATNADIYLDMSSIKYTKRDNIFINSRTTSYTVSSSSGGGGHSGGGGSHSGSSGGGHSSGGGRHG